MEERVPAKRSFYVQVLSGMLCELGRRLIRIIPCELRFGRREVKEGEEDEKITNLSSFSLALAGSADFCQAIL